MTEIVKPNITIQYIENEWKRFLERADRAEQYQFAQIVYWHIRLEPLYIDLHKNWDEHHAEIFMRGLNVMYKSLGWEV